jgi:hypothetical protein
MYHRYPPVVKRGRFHCRRVYKVQQQEEAKCSEWDEIQIMAGIQ